MKYVSLYKRFYKENKSIDKIYKELYESDSTVHFDFKVNNYPIFVSVNNEMLNLISEIQYYDKMIIEKTLGNREVPTVAMNWFIVRTLIDEIKMTNEIEGVSSTRKEIKELVNISEPKGYKRFYGLVNKYLEILSGPVLIKNCEELRKLYDKILYKDFEKEDQRKLPDGKFFRTEQVEVDSGGKAIHFGVMPEEMIIEEMNKSIDLLNDKDINLFIRIAVFHYLFGYIHPFYDGNGRMARFISSAYLVQQLSSLAALQVSVCCKTYQKDYYEMFKITNDIRNKGDLTYFVLKFLEMFKDGLKTKLEEIKVKVEQYEYYTKLLEEKISDKYIYPIADLILQATLFDFEGMSATTIQSISNKSKGTINKYIKKIESLQLLDIEKNGKTYLYTIHLLNLDNIQ